MISEPRLIIQLTALQVNCHNARGERSCMTVVENKMTITQGGCMNRNSGGQVSRRASYCTVLLANLLMPIPRAATAETAADTGANRGDALEEIIVTATKRESDLHDVPISITALSSEDIVRDRIVSLDDVAVHVPGLQYVIGTSAENYLSIRGATTIDDSTGTDQGVSLFIDDIVRTGVGDSAPDLYDVNRVEVLKGPQGTLFGRNSTGGIVAVYTKDPTFTPEILAEATYGRFNLSELKGVLNEPIIDGLLAGRLAVTTHWQDGWVHDVFLGRNLESENRQTARGKLLFTPTQDLKAVLGFDFLKSRGTRTDWVYGNFTPALDAGIIYGRNTTAQGIAGSGEAESWGATARIDWQAPLGALTSISGFRHVTARDFSVTGADPLAAILLTSASLDKQFTQELRFASKLNGKFNWVTGLYYLHSNKSRPIDILFTILPGSFYESIGLGPGQIPSMVRQTTNTSSYGAFGEATYEFVEQLKLTVGARYTYESKNGFSLVNPSGTIAGPPASANYDGSWSSVTPKATLTYQPSKEWLTYITASKGFQGGGFNTQGSTPAALSTPFNPEIVWNYEGGVKFEGFNRRLQVNVSAFVDRYSQLQLISYNSATTTFSTTNAGAADIKGIEAEIAARPAHWLTLGANYTYLHSKFTSYEINNGLDGNGVPLPPTIYTGNKVPFVPSNSVTLSGELHFDAPSLRGHIDVGGDYTYRSSMQLDAANDYAKFIIDKTVWNGMINMHASWTENDDRWSLVLWAKNLRNIDYTSQANDQAGFYETPAEFGNPNNHLYTYHPNLPRTVGITVRAKF
jgi:iron complex outermembrane receptor protein